MNSSAPVRAIVKYGITVIQYNCLEASLATDFPAVDAAWLSWSHRISRLAAEIRSLATGDNNVICLQEVDESNVVELLILIDPHSVYTHEYLRKRGDSKDGTMILHSRNLRCTWVKPMCFRDEETGSAQTQVAILIKFEHFLLVSTHLKAKKNFVRVRQTQMTQLLLAVDEMVGDDAKFPVVIAGDLNDDPESYVLSLAYANRFKSAYPTTLSYTTWKIRPRGEEKRVEDYILLRNAVVSRIVMPPETVPLCGMPNEWSGSDHVALCADVVFV